LLGVDKKSSSEKNYSYRDDITETEYKWVDRDFILDERNKDNKLQYKYKFDIAEVIEYGNLSKEQALELVKQTQQASLSQKFASFEMKSLYSVAIEPSKVTLNYEEVEKKTMDRYGYYGYGMSGYRITRFYHEAKVSEYEVTISGNKLRVWNNWRNYDRRNDVAPQKLLRLFLTVGEEKIYI
jgi:hypothetical protein